MNSSSLAVSGKAGTLQLQAFVQRLAGLKEEIGPPALLDPAHSGGGNSAANPQQLAVVARASRPAAASG